MNPYILTRPVDKLPAVGLLDPLRRWLPSLFALLKQPQSLAQHFGLGLIVTGLEKNVPKRLTDVRGSESTFVK